MAAALHPDAQPVAIGALLARAASRHGSAEALVDPARRLTYAQLAAEAQRMAWGLSRQGVGRGDHVALWMKNRAEWVIAELAVFALGAVLVPINSRCTAAEAEYILRASDCSAVIIGDEGHGVDPLETLSTLCPGLRFPGEPIASRALPQLQRVVCLGARRLPGMIAYERLHAEAPPGGALHALLDVVGADDLAIIIYTSGSTAFPKGVMLTHGQITRNMYEVRVIPEELSATDRVLYVLPLCHIMGALNSVIGLMHVGGCLILRERFSPRSTLEAIEAERPTWFYGVTAMFVDLVRSGLLGRYDTRSLRRFTLFPGPFKAEFLVELVRAFGAEGLNTRYGLTETTNGLTAACTWKDGYERVAQSIGRPIGSCELQIVDPQTRRPVGAGEDGELRVRGFAVMKGYYKMPEETRKVIDEKGWFYTGDLACRDCDGYFYFKGRIKDALKTLGNTVSCLEVESVLARHPAVLSAALVGIPDERAGEVGAAFVQLRPGTICTEEELRAHCRAQLAGYKVPTTIRLVDAVPVSSSGKVQKRVLRDALLAERETDR